MVFITFFGNWAYDLLTFWHFTPRVFTPTSIDGWLQLIILMIPIYFVFNKTGEIHNEVMDKMESNMDNKAEDERAKDNQSNFIKAYKNMLLSIGICGLALAFLNFTDRSHIQLISLPFAFGFLVISTLSLVYIFKFAE